MRGGSRGSDRVVAQWTVRLIAGGNPHVVPGFHVHCVATLADKAACEVEPSAGGVGELRTTIKRVARARCGFAGRIARNRVPALSEARHTRACAVGNSPADSLIGVVPLAC